MAPLQNTVWYIKNHYGKLDGYFLSISISLFLWWLFDYNWAYLVVTLPCIYFLHLFLHREFKTYQYSIAGITSFMWGIMGFYLALKLKDFLSFKLQWDTGVHIIYIVALAVFAYSFYIHFRKFIPKAEKEGDIEIVQSFENIKKNNVARKSLLISSVLFCCFLAFFADAYLYHGFSRKEWNAYQEYLHNGGLAKRRYVDRGPSVFEKADTNSKQLGYIRKATDYDKLLAWTSSQKTTNGMYYVEFTKVPEWWEFIIWKKENRTKSGWFRIEDCTYTKGI